MHSIRHKATRLLMVVTMFLFCSPSLIMAADPNPPQSVRKAHVSTDNQPDPARDMSSEPLPTVTQSVLLPAEYLVIDVMPASGNSFSKGYGVNNHSQVVGRTYNLNEDEEIVDQRALFWNFGTGSTALSTLDGASGAWGINDTGMAWGFATNSAGHQRAVRWDLEDNTLIDLGTLTNPTTSQIGNESYGYRGINNAHTVVGHAEIPNDAEVDRAFITVITNGVADIMVDLNDRIDPAGGWELLTAIDINDMGQITGTGLLNGGKRAFLLTPNADTNTDGDIDGSDIALLSQEVGQTTCNGACHSDFNADDSVDSIDIKLLAMVFGHTR